MKNPSKSVAVIVPADTESLHSITQRFAKNSLSPSARSTYKYQWKFFTEWCATIKAEDGSSPLATLPAGLECISAYVAYMYKCGKSQSTITVALAAIKSMHTEADLPDPTSDTRLKKILDGQRRTMALEGNNTGKPPKPTATLQHIRKLISACGYSDTGIRNRAMILVAFGGWLRRSDLLSMRIERIKWFTDKAVVTLGQTKTDQNAKGQTIELPRITSEWKDLCPYMALKAWLGLCGKASGPVWLQTYHGKITDKPLISPGYFYKMVMATAERAGIPKSEIAPHRTFRATPITMAILASTPMAEVMDKARHKSAQTTTKYFDGLAAGQGRASRAVYGEK